MLFVITDNHGGNKEFVASGEHVVPRNEEEGVFITNRIMLALEPLVRAYINQHITKIDFIRVVMQIYPDNNLKYCKDVAEFIIGHYKLPAQYK